MGNSFTTTAPLPQYTEQTIIDCSQVGNIQAELEFLRNRLSYIQQLQTTNQEEYRRIKTLLDNQYNYCSNRIPTLEQQLTELRSRCGFDF